MGLGNPGRRYQRTRHNLGFRVVDRLASVHRIRVDTRKYESLVGLWHRGEEEVLMVKPQTYMNQSGRAVRGLFRYLPLTSPDLLVVCDDLDLPLGRIRIRERGGSGGHRGIVSILEALGEESFVRIRMGIGRPLASVDPSDYVLEPFAPEEIGAAEESVLRAAAAVETLLDEGSVRAMQKFNLAK